ncbi:RNA polymerase sigma factor [Methylovulum miyakonense]|uniref:RNA polymerase sigma factor n=1 Tax=Methylovulum miyakonense TaxID=645578 RepID=UPI000369C024|nr:RNA polymerase sigma factor [Methylovulum miyakonense]
MFEFTINDIAVLLHKHRGELQRFLAGRIACPETVEDILQIMFLRLSAYQTETRVDNPRAFLFKIAANLATDHLRSQQRRNETLITDEQIDEFLDYTPSPETALISQQQLAVLKQAIQELPPKCRDVFILCKFHHYTYLQAAQHLGIAESTATKHMIKALEHCKRRVFDDSF